MLNFGLIHSREILKMAKAKKVAAPKAAQALSKEMKQMVTVMIEKALKPSHKQLSDLQEKLKALKMDKSTPQKPKLKKAKKTMKVVVLKAKASSKAKVKAKSKKTKSLKDLAA